MTNENRPIVQFTFPTPDTSGFEELKELCDVRYSDEYLTDLEGALDKLDPHTAILATDFTQSVSQKVMDHFKDLRLVANYAVGYNNIDIHYAKDHDITVSNTPNAVVNSTAELTLALLLSLSRRVAEWDRTMRFRRSNEKGGLNGKMGHDLFGKKVGIIGFGNIGRRVAHLLSAFGCSIYYNKRHRLTEEQEKELDVTFAEVDEILSKCDIISLHTPLNDDTKHLIDSDALSKMKRNAMLVNLSRGPVVDEKALVKALKEGIIGGAALDVYEYGDKPLDELYDLPNVVLTPHVGTQTVEARHDMRVELANNIIGFLKGDRRVAIVDVTR